MFAHSDVADDDVANRGRGAAYEEVKNAINNRRVTIISAIGYSWGGGAAFSLVDRLRIDRNANPNIITSAFTVAFTAYIDAVRHVNQWAPETRRPPYSAFHANYFQRTDLLRFRGSFTQDSRAGEPNLDVNTEEWGVDLRHRTIEDDVALPRSNGRIVLLRVRDGLKDKVQR